MKKFSLPKEERLSSKIALNELFASKKSVLNHPLKVIWKVSPSEFPKPAQIVVTVPKRLFKKAVKRNLLKRRIREGYRLNKNIILDLQSQHNLTIAFVYIGHKEEEFKHLQTKIILSLQRIAKDLVNV